MVLTDLYKMEYLSLEFSSLLQEASSITLTMTTEQASAVEARTRDQANSRLV